MVELRKETSFGPVPVDVEFYRNADTEFIFWPFGLDADGNPNALPVDFASYAYEMVVFAGSDWESPILTTEGATPNMTVTIDTVGGSVTVLLTRATALALSWPDDVHYDVTEVAADASVVPLFAGSIALIERGSV